MNCAESQDLLLDLAYGELPPARAAEVEEHVLGCASCRAEKEQLDDARASTAPLRDLEEPPAGFDEPILRAARAEASMQADGTPGPVVEVSASVKPLGLPAARLDPHARMRGGKDRPRPRWWRRAAVLGSVVAAAGLAVVVTSSLTNRASRPGVQEEVAPIQVRAPGAPVPASVGDALSSRDEREARPDGKGVPAGGALPPQTASAPPPAKKDAAPQLGKAKPARRDAPGEPAVEKRADRAAGGLSEQYQDKAGPPAGGPPSDALRLRAATRAPAKAEEPKARAAERSVAAVESPPAAMVLAAPAAANHPAVAADPDQIEDQASTARRQGDYLRAAALYREASALRRQADPARAAWDMAHAVECLAAGGQIDQAVAARKELLRTFPDQSGPKGAADSALRSVRLPPDQEQPPPVK
jgi:hypothetical protein